jgi:N-acetyl-anhydromuramyl-L-alanine amidase AmpD
MKASSIPAHEAAFLNNGIDALGKKFRLTPASVANPNSSTPLQYLRCDRENGDNSFYLREQASKHSIVLHHTAGYLKGDVAALTQPGNKVSVPFVIARNGIILNLWSSKYWAYHLGPGAIGGNTVMSRSSIGIELSNIGYLKPLNGSLVTAYADADVYCTTADTALYRVLPTPFRGCRHFATFTAAQYESLISLVRFLCARYQIPRTLLPETDRYSPFTASAALAYRGICSHVNFRPAGKWDIGPAFDWARLAAGLA